jgi:hypothetical protein
MVTKIAWKLYKAQYIMQCLVAQEVYGELLTKCTSARKLRILNALDCMNAEMLSNIRRCHNFSEWAKWVNGAEWRYTWQCTVQNMAEQFASKINELELDAKLDSQTEQVVSAFQQHAAKSPNTPFYFN